MNLEDWLIFAANRVTYQRVRNAIGSAGDTKNPFKSWSCAETKAGFLKEMQPFPL